MEEELLNGIEDKLNAIEAIKAIRKLLYQIDLEVEEVPLNSKSQIKELMIGLKGQELNVMEEYVLDRLLNQEYDKELNIKSEV